MVARSVGRRRESMKLFTLYGQLYSRPLPDNLQKERAVAEIVDAGDNENNTAEFSLATERRLRIFALGEAFRGKMYDYGWIENVRDGTTVWEMR